MENAKAKLPAADTPSLKWKRVFAVIFLFVVATTVCLRLKEPLPTSSQTYVRNATSIATARTQTFQRKPQTTLLSVPFYVYEDLLWHNMTYGDKKLSEMLEDRPTKNSDDYWTMKASLRHPMRTLDPERAQLFLVPTLMNFASDGIAGGNCCNNGLCNQELVDFTTNYLAHSKYYQLSKGKDHIMVLSNWYSTHRPDIFKNNPVLPTLNQIQMADRTLVHENRVSFPSTYVGDPCPVAFNGNKTHDFVMVGSLWEKAPPAKKARFQSRRDLCQWLTTKRRHYRYSICGPGPQCPALAQAKYGFHVRGDTWGANRLMDTLLSGTVPIFTNEEQYKILPSWIDWKLLSVQVSLENPPAFLSGLDHILSHTDYDAKLQHVLDNRDLLDWHTGIPFDVYMFMFQRSILPQTVVGKPFNPYSFSALKLDA